MLTLINTKAYGRPTVGLSEELAAESIRDEIIWSSYAGLGQRLGLLYFCTLSLRGQSSDIHLTT